MHYTIRVRNSAIIKYTSAFKTEKCNVFTLQSKSWPTVTDYSQFITSSSGCLPAFILYMWNRSLKMQHTFLLIKYARERRCALSGITILTSIIS